MDLEYCESTAIDSPIESSSCGGTDENLAAYLGAEAAVATFITFGVGIWNCTFLPGSEVALSS